MSATPDDTRSEAALALYQAAGISASKGSAGKDAAWNALSMAARLWRGTGNYVGAAIAMRDALHAAWGDGARVTEAVNGGIDDCLQCVSKMPLDSLEALAAIEVWLTLVNYCDEGDARKQREWLYQELAERLLLIFGERPESVGFLVRGIILTGSPDGGWRAVVPSRVLVFGTSSTGGGEISMSLTSAFAAFRMLGDYDTLRTLVERFPAEFESVTMRGWKLALEAMYATTERAERFQAAADAFAADVCPTDEEFVAQGGGAWSGENVNNWAKHFRAHAALARIESSREQAQQHIADALEALEGTFSGQVKEETFRLHLVVKVLGALAGVDDPVAIDKAKEELRVARWVFGTGKDLDAIESLLADTAIALQEFTEDPENAIASSRITQLQDTLARIPAIGTELAKDVGPAIKAHALSVIRGIDRARVHGMLERVKKESVLQGVFLRLLRASLPRYAQIRQGPIEYGKDVVVLVEESGRRILRMYQLKVGNLKMGSWPKLSSQLEQIFTVPLETVHVTSPVDERQGFLVCNGHAEPHLDPIMKGWFKKEFEGHGHKYEFLHLDALARWIVDEQLYGTLRAALRDAGIAPTPPRAG